MVHMENSRRNKVKFSIKKVKYQKKEQIYSLSFRNYEWWGILLLLLNYVTVFDDSDISIW